ncbi:protein-L-isoaspartate O-methyltransferase domain-containing protein 2-like [Metopolophium dirhodum]|uniref:protein-L-isoaspartate O-methyltransferase domain-containing protein 2-like n=1 Tax=Metopolophium dirhodum TaxID=44670 RepID=UPI00298F6989|nr:protein-L-isoaspartate O-methyltransferase domain-containing protein 2-like [Metopolophium dirhodum]
MGQLESTNRAYYSNDELINALIERECIHSINVEKVFRSVDRGLYYTNDNKLNAYRDTDWQSGDVYLSAPSAYATVLECLDIHKGHKFLNIGSGIGYFSTLAGLLLGVNGVNHGIEIHSYLIDIAYQKLKVFKQNSAAIDYFEFCEPVFIKGNAFELKSVGYYDRVFCGAEVPLAKSSFMKALIKIGGVLVMPLKGFLVKVIRYGEHSWKTNKLLKVSMPDLVVAEKFSSMKVSKFPTVEPLSLQELCRSNIRASIRDCLYKSHPRLQMRTKCKPNVTKRYNQTFFSSDPMGHILEEYATIGETISIQNYIEDSKEETSDLDTGSGSGNEAIEEDNDDSNNGDDVEEKNTTEQCDKSLLKKTASDNKRKASEAECSEQNKTLPEKPENTKRKRMNSLSSTVKNLSSNHSTNSCDDFLETMSNDSSESDDEENDQNGEDGFYNALVDDHVKFTCYYSNEFTRELIKYGFLSNRKENNLSKLLKFKINLLPLPAMLKVFLNYRYRNKRNNLTDVKYVLNPLIVELIALITFTKSIISLLHQPQMK